MKLRAPIRALAGMLLLWLLLPAGAAAQRGIRRGGPRAGARMMPPARRAPLGTGLERLSQLPPEQREQRLRQDPNFQRLPPAQQQRMLNGLRRLNAMTPQQQQRVIQRLHNLGKLNPRQRAGLEQIFRQFQTMPPARRQAFRAAYNNLRQLPPEQRELRLSRPEFQQRFSPEELKSLHQALGLNLPADVVGARPPGGF